MITLAEITAKCSPELLSAGNYHDIAAVVNVGRVRYNTTEVGNGLILDVLGFEVGNVFLDAVNANPMFRYVVPLLNQGRLDIAKTSTRAAIDMLATAGVPGFGTTEAEALKALAKQSLDTVSWEQCREAVERGV